MFFLSTVIWVHNSVLMFTSSGTADYFFKTFLWFGYSGTLSQLELKKFVNFKLKNKLILEVKKDGELFVNFKLGDEM